MEVCITCSENTVNSCYLEFAYLEVLHNSKFHLTVIMKQCIKHTGGHSDHKDDVVLIQRFAGACLRLDAGHYSDVVCLNGPPYTSTHYGAMWRRLVRSAASHPETAEEAMAVSNFA